jgi:hypothetical protein
MLTDTESDLLETLEETARHLRLALYGPAEGRAQAIEALSVAVKKCDRLRAWEDEQRALDRESAAENY